jgi:outer membrane protein TolC
MMIKFPIKNIFLISAIIANFIFLPEFTLLYAAVAQNAGVPVSAAADERQIEKDREDELLNALSKFDPSLKDLTAPQTGKASGMDEKAASFEVEKLRRERKVQFKRLTQTYINQMITKESVLAKAKFIEERDKNLGKVVERAAGVHVPAQVARERMGLAKFRIAKSIRDFFPELTFTVDQKHGVLSPLLPYNSKNWRLAMRQPLFHGGVLYNTLLMELTNLEIARKDYDKTISDLVADVSQAYFEFERAKNTQSDQVEFFELAKEQKRISDEKYKASIISEIEKLNVDSLYSQAMYDVETAQQELEIARLELQKFLKLDSRDPVDLAALYKFDALNVDALRASKTIATSENPRAFEESLGQFIELAYTNRSDLQVEASKLKAAQLQYRIALGRKLPQADFIFEMGQLGEAYEAYGPYTQLGTNNPPMKNEYRYGVEMSWPLGGNTAKYTYDNDKRAASVTTYEGQSGTRTSTNSFSFSLLDDMGQFSSIKEAKINSLEQIVELEKTERDVVREVKEAYFNFNKAIIQVESAFKRTGYRKRLADVAKHRLGQNEIQISEYLQAQIDYRGDRGLVYKALSEFFLSKAKLNRAIGIRDYLSIDVLG